MPMLVGFEQRGDLQVHVNQIEFVAWQMVEKGGL